MFSDFAKVFSRDFLVGYFLPAALFATSNVGLYVLFVAAPGATPMLALADIVNIWTVSLFVFAAWLFAVLLMAANRVMVRVLEGYHLLNRTPLLKYQQRQFDKLRKDIRAIEEQYRQEEAGTGVRPETVETYMKLLLRFRTYYPSSREHVLATGLGNAIRAFEVYSSEMYGIDSIPVWSRIVAVVPDEYREMVNSYKAQVDFAVNIVYLSSLVAFEYGVYGMFLRKAPMLWVPLLAVLVAWLAYSLAISASVQWGDWVKAIFDVYRGDLLERIGIKRPINWAKEREMWTELSQSFLYWYPIELPRTTRPTERRK